MASWFAACASTEKLSNSRINTRRRIEDVFVNFEATANETFQILRSYDYEVLLFDEEHMQVFEPEEARRFFAKPENLLVSIVDDGEDSAVRLYLSKSTELGAVMGLVSALRAMTTKYKMIFHLRKYDRDLGPKDFATKASVSENKNNKKEVSSMNIVEGMYGTSRSSYLKLENARMIVRHSAKIDENVVGARGRHIDAVYIENAQGERHLFATTQLAPARAMVNHVDQGGSWADSVGEQISRMASDFAACGSASRHIGFYGNDLTEAAQEVRTKLRENLREMRRAFESFGRKTRYVEMCEHFSAMAAAPLVESEDDTTKIAELASLLNTSSVQLSESVLSTVARVVEANVEGKYYPPKLQKEKNIELTHVLNHPVSKAAWEAFKNGTLELIQQPKIEGMKFGNEAARDTYIFREVARCTKDDGMANLLAWVSSELPLAKGQMRAKLMVVRKQALKAVGLYNEPEPGVEAVAAGSQAIKEHIDWMKSFSVSKLMEFDRFPLPDYSDEDHNERTLASVVDEFDYDRFMASSSARDFHYSVLSNLDDEERTIDFHAIHDAVEHYLESELDHREVTGMNVHGEADRIAKEVMNHMIEDGYHVEGQEEADAPVENQPEFAYPMAAEEAEPMVDEFADEVFGGDDIPLEVDEDILLPKNQENDLLGDVSKATVVEPETGEETLPDNGYIDRLLSLAGRSNR
jgi:hypothetical protein